MTLGVFLLTRPKQHYLLNLLEPIAHPRDLALLNCRRSCRRISSTIQQKLHVIFKWQHKGLDVSRLGGCSSFFDILDISSRGSILSAIRAPPSHSFQENTPTPTFCESSFVSCGHHPCRTDFIICSRKESFSIYRGEDGRITSYWERRTNPSFFITRE